MELNRAQLLVHDDRAIEKLRSKYGIPTNVKIEHLRPNDVPHVVEDNPDRIPICIWLIYRAELRFLISLLLKDVMARCRLTFMQISINLVYTVLAVDMLMQILHKPFNAEDLLHVYTVVWLKREPTNLLYEGNHYLCLRRPDQPQTRLIIENPNKGLFLDEFVWVSGSWEFRARDDGLWSFPRYNGCFPNSKYSFH